MPTKKVYRVLMAFSSADKDGNAVHVSRETEHLIPDLLTQKRIAELVAGELLEESTVDSEGHSASHVVTAEVEEPRATRKAR